MNDEEVALATDEDALVEPSDNSTLPEDGPQEDVPQEPISEDDVEVEDDDYEAEVYG